MIRQGNEEALALMVEKYRYMIAKKIGKFNLANEYDDAFQEGILVLYRSVLRFQTSFNKTFTRYYENNLENAFISLVRKKNSYGRFLSEKLPMLCETTIRETGRTYVTRNDIAFAVESLSSFEKTIFKLCFIEGRAPGESAKLIGCKPKKVYNAIERIRHKLKTQLEL